LIGSGLPVSLGACGVKPPPVTGKERHGGVNDASDATDDGRDVGAFSGITIGRGCCLVALRRLLFALRG
jgi:hypothetical protein